MDKRLEQLFRDVTGTSPETAVRLTPAGSNRIYYRLTGAGRTLVGTEGTSDSENCAFLSIGQHLYSKGLPVPEILAMTDDGMCYLQEDLGDASVFETLKADREAGVYRKESVELLEEVIRALPRFQIEGGQGMDFSVCYPCPAFDRRSILWDLNYFKYCFLKALDLDFHEAQLEDDFEKMVSTLLADAPYETFMYRDFQARNVMVKDGKPYFIDFQGGRRGPLEYDLASFVWQSRAAYPEELKEHLVSVYMDALAAYRPVDRTAMRHRLDHFILFRTLQTLGAYGFRGYFERKSVFLESISKAIAGLPAQIDKVAGEYPYMEGILRQMAALPRFAPAAEDGRLTVRITSFSFRKGIPEDNSGNGGGFVFDCRGMTNPGRFEEYRKLNGTDAPVLEFLDAQNEIQPFLEHVEGLVDPCIDKYLKRGFTSLAISFGCTGGQHRSVCCAERTALRLHRKYGSRIRIVLEHREQGYKGILQ